MFDQAEHRDPGHRRTWVVLVDGARHQIDLIKAEAEQRGADIHIIVDLIHVLGIHVLGASAKPPNSTPASPTP
ncbi:hypothetical protein NMN56_022415 [Streptomyces iconiensis]|uniref:Transposase n=1 Tax=Streptomyces iconiensis TaxID=1384038 RepID=A0ABT7A0S5_9ACTN|nr:hypothetical protein [Streptomyces iconiensis]MDJ1134664.1 hypothetical protein [Streptomyces iconiensis]